MEISVGLNILLGSLEAPQIAVCLFYFLSHMKRTIYQKKKYYAIAFAVDVLIIVMGSFMLRNDVITCLGHGVLTVVVGYYLFYKSKRQIFFNLFYVLGSFFLMALVVNGFLIWLPHQPFMSNITMSANIALVLKFIVNIMFTKLFILLGQGISIENTSKKTILSLFIPLGISGAIYVMILHIASIYIQMHGFGLIQCCLVLLIGLNLYFLFLLVHLSKSASIRNELELLQRQSDTQYSYYEALEEKYQESRKIIHDMRNHLLALEQLYQVNESSSASKYAADIHRMMNRLGQNYYTNHRMLNIILNDKIEQAIKYEIQMKVEVGDVNLSGIKDIDITTVFGNLLDNAIEAAKLSVEDGGEGYVGMKADCFHEFNVVRICNSMTSTDYGRAKEHKGLGLLNVEKVLERYHGGMQVKRGAEEFQVSVTIPRDVNKGREKGGR